MPEEAQYNYLKVLGPLRMESVTPRDLKGERVRVCILMGPTGSGKSAFIEVLAPEQGLCISGDSLDGVTQTVVCYRVNNLQDGKLPVIIMDTPGLLDPGISESRVISMISNELDTLRGSVEMAVVTLCYFHAIDIARVAGTKRDAVEFLRGFAQTFKANNVNVVTTMWNKLWNDKQTTDAEQRFNALQVEIYRSLPSLHVSLDRFYSTAASTLSILDACRHGWYQTTRKQRITLPTYDNMIRQGLVGRIQNIQRNLDNFADDDHQVQAICEAEHKAALLLYEFCRDLYDCAPDAYSAIFPDAPCPPTTFDCQPSLSELVCYRSMSSMQIQPTSTGAASIHHAIPHHFPSPEPPLTDKLSWRWIKRFRMLEGRVREGIKAFAKPTKLVQAGDSQVLNVDPDLVAVISKLQNLTVTGNISVEPMTAEIPENAKVYM
ncbi:hypothetical protein BJ165DRAFT_862002 [Panaeolus papilionaceus]|nr:hypothetical protein BJ165DRAFT_862002 [Panaeolus papilionaceus]